MKSAAKTGFITNATINEANSVAISVMGKYRMNSPMMPGQNMSGTNGATLTSVPLNTGKKTSPAAFFTAKLMGMFSSWKIRCVFSMTTIASSTTMPNASRKANMTTVLSVNLRSGKTKAKAEMITNAMNADSGTESPTNSASVVPMKNMSTNTTNTKPRITVATKSLSVFWVSFDWSPVTVTVKPSGNLVALYSLMISSIFSDAVIRFSPPRLITLSESTALPSSRAKSCFSLKLSSTSAISFRNLALPRDERTTTLRIWFTSLNSPVTRNVRRTPFTFSSPPDTLMFSAAMACEISLKVMPEACIL